MTDYELLIETCHDLINRAMRCDDPSEYGGDTRMGDEYRAKERAIRNMMSSLQTAQRQLEALRSQVALLEQRDHERLEAKCTCPDTNIAHDTTNAACTLAEAEWSYDQVWSSLRKLASQPEGER